MQDLTQGLNPILILLSLCLSVAHLCTSARRVQLQVSGNSSTVQLRSIFGGFVADVYLLTSVGAQEIIPAKELLGQVCTKTVYAILWVLFPLLSLLKKQYQYNSQNKVDT
jgi:hypothetical protein